MNPVDMTQKCQEVIIDYPANCGGGELSAVKTMTTEDVSLSKKSSLRKKDMKKVDLQAQLKRDSKKNCRVKIKMDGFCTFTKQKLSWDCNICKLQPKPFFSAIDLICHIVQDHTATLVFQCTICGQCMDSADLGEHYNSHSRFDMVLHSVLPTKDETLESNLQYDDVKIEPSSVVLVSSDEEDIPLEHLVKVETNLVEENVGEEWKYDCDPYDGSLTSNSTYTKQITGDNGKGNREDAKEESAQIEDHEKKDHLCSFCGKTFAFDYKLKIHSRMHTGEKPYSCSQCGKTFSMWSNLKRHIRVHTGEKPYLCTICGKSFNQASSFKVHTSIHYGAKPHKKKPTLSSSRVEEIEDAKRLQEAARISLEERKKYKCELCKKKFSTSGTLKIHQRVHTKEKPYECKTCLKRFTQKISLTLHIRNHTGEKPHACPHCFKTFKLAACLKIHVRTHTGERPFKCNQCDKAFSMRSNLTRHKDTHTGLKRFSCDYCHKEFTQRTGLIDHVNVHTGARPYSCPHCSSTFANHSTLSKHISKHKIKNTTE